MSTLERKEVVLKVRDLMTKNLVSVDRHASIMDTARLMVEKGITSVLVRHGEEFSGMITDRDIIARVVSKGADPTKVKVSEVMSSPLLGISGDATIEEAAKKMRDNRVRRLIIESDHHTTGIITESDIIRVTPELHFLIRERSKLEAGLSSTEPQQVVLAGFCEECENYSAQLRNVNGTWLCEDCGGG
jgi:CBS domain-containing protein